MITNNLPPELIKNIIKDLPLRDIAVLRGLSRDLCSVVSDLMWAVVADRLEIGSQDRDTDFHEIKKPSWLKRAVHRVKREKPSLDHCPALKKAYQLDDANLRYPRIIVNYIRKVQSKGLDTFFEGSLETIRLRAKLGIPPSKEAIPSGIEKMKFAALAYYRDAQTFDTCAEFVLPKLDDSEMIITLFARAIGTLPLSTTEKMAKIKPCDRSDIRISNAVNYRTKQNPEFVKYKFS